VSRPERLAQYFVDVDVRRRRVRERLAELENDVGLLLEALWALVSVPRRPPRPRRRR
jgi:hypothetical protein